MIRLPRRTPAWIATLVAAVLLLSGCSIYDVPLPGGPSVGSNPMKITIMFRDVLDLVPQSTVKINDLSVGKVTNVSLKGYVAKVTVELPDSVKLPDNALAQIRQTSLLGEKFVSLSPPSNPSSNLLRNGDVIGLDRTGRNPEVEEVFGALALLLNGGGVGQLKTIASELNNAFGGRESEVRSVLEQIRLFMTQLNTNRDSVVAALENTSRLAAELRQGNESVKGALDNIPAALSSLNGQRQDLVALLKALTRLSGIGVKVIQASKASTINSLRDLAPVLDGFAQAGQNFPKSFQVFLTYPFVDAAVGQDPQVARNLHMGDYTNLSVNLDISVADLPKTPSIPTPACDLAKRISDEVTSQVQKLPNLPGGLGEKELIAAVTKAVTGVSCSTSPTDLSKAVGTALTDVLNSPLVQKLCPTGSTNPLCQALNGTGGAGGVVGGLTGGGGGIGGTGITVPRANLGAAFAKSGPIDPFNLAALGLDPGIGTMLLQGVAQVR